MVTHDHDVLEHCDRVMEMIDGQLSPAMTGSERGGSAMPRITAPTVAQHRAERHRALLDAAQALLAEDPGQAPLARRRRGPRRLARSSVYEYFRSQRRPARSRWSGRCCRAGPAGSPRRWPPPAPPGEKVLAYVGANLQLVSEGEHAVATALAQHVPGEELHAAATQMHEGMRAPLIAALTALGLPDPAATAGLVSAVVYTPPA